MTKIRFKDYLKDYLDFYHITISDFAKRIEITPKTLIGILAGEVELSAKVIQNISFVTSIPVEYIFNVEGNYKLEENITRYLTNNNLTLTSFLNKFNYNYLKKEDYLDFVDKDDKMEVAKDILKFLRVVSPEQIYKLETNGYYKSRNDKLELLTLWLEKCYRETLKQKVKSYSKENINVLINFILQEALKGKFDKEKLINKFNDQGIYLVILEDIPGSKIRGAFRVHKGIPAIYLTLKHKRIADIYFSLLHELAHCKSDFNKAQKSNLVSFLDDTSEIESKRDAIAYNWMVDNAYYEKIVKDKDYKITEEIRYPKSFIVYRLACDKLIDFKDVLYQKYNILITKE